MLGNAAGLRLKLGVDGICRPEVPRIAHAVVGNPEAIHQPFQGSEPSQAGVDHLLDDRIAHCNDPGFIVGGAHCPLYTWRRVVGSGQRGPQSPSNASSSCKLMLLRANCALWPIAVAFAFSAAASTSLRAGMLFCQHGPRPSTSLAAECSIALRSAIARRRPPAVVAVGCCQRWQPGALLPDDRCCGQPDLPLSTSKPGPRREPANRREGAMPLRSVARPQRPAACRAPPAEPSP